MPQDIVLEREDGYSEETAPTVNVNVFGPWYTARRPKNTTPFLFADAHLKMQKLGQLDDSEEENREEVAREVEARLKDAKDALWTLGRSIFSPEDTDALMARMLDPGDDMDLTTMFTIFSQVQTRFPKENKADQDAMGLEPAKQKPVKKTAGKATSRKPGTKKAAGAKKATTRK